MRVEKAYQTRVQRIDPNDRLLGIVDVIVSYPIRLNQQISRLHDHWLAIGCSISTAAFDHEAERRVSVSVCRGGFTGKHDLKSHSSVLLPVCKATLRRNASGPMRMISAV